MCEDLEAARQNRERQHKNLSWWLWYEGFVKSYPRRKPLLSWMIGKLPVADKSERVRDYGIYEIGDDGLLK